MRRRQSVLDLKECILAWCCFLFASFRIVEIVVLKWVLMEYRLAMVLTLVRKRVHFFLRAWWIVTLIFPFYFWIGKIVLLKNRFFFLLIRLYFLFGDMKSLVLKFALALLNIVGKYWDLLWHYICLWVRQKDCFRFPRTLWLREWRIISWRRSLKLRWCGNGSRYCG